MRAVSLLLALVVFAVAGCTTGNSGNDIVQAGDMIFRGTVSALTESSVTFNSKVFDLLPTTQYFLNNNTEGTFSDLHVGDYALFAAHQNDNGSLSVTKLQVLDDTSGNLEAAGLVTAVSANSITVNGIQWTVNGATEFTGGLSSLAGIQVGQVVQVEGPESSGNFTASEITSEIESTDVGHAVVSAG